MGNKLERLGIKDIFFGEGRSFLGDGRLRVKNIFWYLGSRVNLRLERGIVYNRE